MSAVLSVWEVYGVICAPTGLVVQMQRKINHIEAKRKKLGI
jgi:hypothetical protein